MINKTLDVILIQKNTNNINFLNKMKMINTNSIIIYKKIINN